MSSYFISPAIIGVRATKHEENLIKYNCNIYKGEILIFKIYIESFHIYQDSLYSTLNISGREFAHISEPIQRTALVLVSS